MAKNPELNAKTLPEDKRNELYKRLTDWKQAKSKSAEWSAKERELRDSIMADFFTGTPEGTTNMKLDFGKKLKAVRSISRSPDKEQLNALLAIERAKIDPKTKQSTSNILPLLDEVIVYKPEVSTTAWKGLSDDSRKLIANVVIEKPGAPTLEIVDA